MLNPYVRIGMAAVLSAAPLLAWSWQDVDSDSEKRWLQPPDERRAYVKVTNDWRDTVRLTMWTRRGEQVGDHWTLDSGQSGTLRYNGRRITATGEYSIKVGDDPAATTLESVATRSGNVWRVRVRDIWRATHAGGRGGYDLDQR